MDYSRWNMVLILMVVIAAELATVVSSWQSEWHPNYVSKEPEWETDSKVFEGEQGEDDGFKLLLVEGNKAFVGAKNRVYYMSLTDVKYISDLEWKPDEMSSNTCTMKGKQECENYIRVLVRKSQDRFYICGTNAFQPRCRHYVLEENGQLTMSRQDEEGGTGVCPFDPNHNSTAVFTDGKLYSATVADSDSRDPLILQKNNENKLMRTQPRDSIFLNEPNFVSSFDKDDKVLFFFRETAVENINCGKAVFSRVGRVCKQDQGGAIRTLQNTFTSFFKARLNCSIPGEFPFYFDEIQSTSEFGQGNYRPTKDSGDRSDMIYGVFNTPENSIKGSAVCAFRYSDISDVFRGRFKGQDSFRHNWLPVNWDLTPSPHPEKCTNNSQDLSYESLNFIKTHPLMDEAVPARGGMPMLVFTSFKSKFTQIAIDWQVLAADKKYYDVMFVGTDDGRVIKAINKGEGAKIESVVIEDIQVLEPDDPVVSLRVLSDRTDDSVQSLVVVSSRKIVSIPLHRCHRATTCSSCVALQDPYCVWNGGLQKCVNAQSGFQNILTGKHDSCKPDVTVEEVTAAATVKEPAQCFCPVDTLQGSSSEKSSNKNNQDIGDKPTKAPPSPPNERDNQESNEVDNEGRAAASTTAAASGTAIEIVIVAVIVSIIGSLVLGFFIGFKFQSCRYARDRDNVFYDRNCSSLQRGRNRLSSGDNPYFHTDHTSLAPKQMNYVVNMKNGKANTGIETKPVTKSNKVYL